MNILNNKFFTIFAIIVVGFLGYAVVQKIPAYLAIRNEVKYANTKLAQTAEYKKELELENANIENEAYLERQARLKLNYQKPGEQLVYIYHTDENAQKEDVASKSSGFIQRLLNWFGK